MTKENGVFVCIRLLLPNQNTSQENRKIIELYFPIAFNKEWIDFSYTNKGLAFLLSFIFKIETEWWFD